ncbi:MAG: hypothetical protein F6K40_05160 [Okeania sp. SIO3I5]|uniref:hypothetical protein n=1 Tax=Okeania sp. SIO3I5 TaxID=2607805 RepID=UPI0013BD4D9A|nr:hypothetical protein [Okeania sp. SIO3I5]NEQ35711.1 hypothetical protein [Okeania sp. SIO3I5]
MLHLDILRKTFHILGKVVSIATTIYSLSIYMICWAICLMILTDFYRQFCSDQRFFSCDKLLFSVLTDLPSPYHETMLSGVNVFTFLALPIPIAFTFHFLCKISETIADKNSDVTSLAIPKFDYTPSLAIAAADLIIIFLASVYIDEFLWATKTRFSFLAQTRFTLLYIVLNLTVTLIKLVSKFALIQNVASVDSAREYLKKLISEPPYITFRVRVYKTEQRTRTVFSKVEEQNPYSDDPYDTITVTYKHEETYDEIVANYEKEKPYDICSWRDKTNKNVFSFPTRLYFDKNEDRTSDLSWRRESKTRL